MANSVVQGTELLTADQAAGLLRVRRARIYELIRDNQIPAVRIGRQVRVHASKLAAWVDSGGFGLPPRKS